MDEIKRLVGYTLGNLEQDARASVRDIEGIGGVVPISEPEAGAVLQLAPVAENGVPAAPSLGILIDEEIACNCPKCGFSNTARLNTAPGSTRHLICANCDAKSFVHRLAGGNYRVVNPFQKRLSPYALGRSPTRTASFPAMPPAARAAVATNLLKGPL